MTDETATVPEPTLIEKLDASTAKAEAVAKRIEDANRKTEELLVRQTLGGKSEAGAEPPVVDPEKKKIEDAKGYFKGTIIENMLK